MIYSSGYLFIFVLLETFNFPISFQKAIPCAEKSHGRSQRKRETSESFKPPHMIVGPRGKINAISFPLNAVVEEVQGATAD